jgi:hypothetical protein
MAEPEIEYELVTVKVPKRLLNFLRALEKCLGLDIDQYLTSAIVDSFGGDLDILEIPFIGKKRLIEKFGLDRL